MQRANPKLSLIRARIRQRPQPTPGKNLLKLFSQNLMHQAIRCQRLATVKQEWRAIEARDRAARFFHDQHTSRRVPRIEIELPEAVKASAGHVAQIERGRSSAAYAVRSQRDLVVEVNIRILVPLV